MSREHQLAVKVGLDADLAELLDEVEAAYRRAEKSEPGERGEIARYEALSSVVELSAATALFDGRGSTVDVPDPSTRRGGLFVRHADSVVVALTLPLGSGAVQREAVTRMAPPPAEPLKIRDDVRGRQLVLDRFREQLDAAIAQPGKDRLSALSPSGVHNRILTEVLREYVRGAGRTPVSVPVIYRDGSRATAAFPFHCLDLTTEALPDEEERARGTTILKLALLSIRHTEMDAIVDGAWLRNAEVSKPRPAAQTDDYVYTASVKQLEELTADGRRKVRLYIFQTGLETAVVGFFRAVTAFLSKHPGRLEVIPMFFASNGPVGSEAVGEFAGYERGDVWATSAGGE